MIKKALLFYLISLNACQAETSKLYTATIHVSNKGTKPWSVAVALMGEASGCSVTHPCTVNSNETKALNLSFHDLNGIITLTDSSIPQHLHAFTINSYNVLYPHSPYLKYDGAATGVVHLNAPQSGDITITGDYWNNPFPAQPYPYQASFFTITNNSNKPWVVVIGLVDQAGYLLECSTDDHPCTIEAGKYKIVHTFINIEYNAKDNLCGYVKFTDTNNKVTIGSLWGAGKQNLLEDKLYPGPFIGKIDDNTSIEFNSPINGDIAIKADALP